MQNKEVQTELKDINFGIVEINIIGFELLPRPSEAEVSSLIHEVGIDFNLDKEEEIFVVAPYVRILNNSEEVLSRLMIACVFNIELMKNVKLDKNAPYLPMGLVEVFSSISLSTLRGVLFSQLKGTYLNEAILPIIDPKKVIEVSLLNNTK